MKVLGWLFGSMILVYLFGCQRELHEFVPVVNPIDSATQLIKVATFSLPDSLVVFERDFEYETNGKLRAITTTERFQQPNGNIRTLIGKRRFLRDNQNRIVRINSGPDTSVFSMEFSYPSTNSLNPVSAVSTRTRGGITTLLDSVSVVYGSNGRIVRTVRFALLNGGKLDTSSYETYTYDVKGNLAGKQQYSDSAGNRIFRVVIGYSWEYDNKPNPLYFDEVAYFFNEGPFAYTASSNNVLRQVNNYVIFPSDQLNYLFEYNQDNRPIFSRSVGDKSLFTKYYYQ